MCSVVIAVYSRMHFKASACWSMYLGGWVHAIEKPNPAFPCRVRRLVVVKGVRPPLLPIPGPTADPKPRPGPESPEGSSSRCRRKLLSSLPVSDKNMSVELNVQCHYYVLQDTVTSYNCNLSNWSRLSVPRSPSMPSSKNPQNKYSRDPVIGYPMPCRKAPFHQQQTHIKNSKVVFFSSFKWRHERKENESVWRNVKGKVNETFCGTRYKEINREN